MENFIFYTIETLIVGFAAFYILFGIWFMIVKSIYGKIAAILILILMALACVLTYQNIDTDNCGVTYYNIYLWMVMGISGMSGARLGWTYAEKIQEYEKTK